MSAWLKQPAKARFLGNHGEVNLLSSESLGSECFLNEATCSACFSSRGLGVIESVQKCNEDSSSEVSVAVATLFPMDFDPVVIVLFF